MIYLTGDTHIPIDIDKLSMKNFPAQKKLTRNDYVIVLGDFGLLWKEDKTYKYWLDILSKRNFTLLFIDGNHENFDWLNSLPTKPWNDGRVHEIAPNILHLMRGYVFNIDKKKFFVMGGADSYDRVYRTPYVSWWPQERPNSADIRQTEKALRAVDNKVDYVLTHTCPVEVLTAIKNRHPEYSFDNEDHYVENLLQDIKDRLIFKEWFFGHWHENFAYKNYRCLYDDIICLEKERKTMEPKFKLGDRVRYIGKKRYGNPIPGKEYHITSEAMYCSPPMGADFVVGDFEYDIAPAPENDDPNDHYTYIKEEYLVLVNPSKIIFG